MPPRPARLSIAPLALLVLLSACGDDDGTGPGEQVPTTIEIGNDPISFDLAGQTEQLDITVLDADGTPIADPTVTFSSTNTDVASVAADGLVTALGNGTADIEVQAGTATATIGAEVDITPAALQDGVPVEDLSAPEGGQLFFTFEVPPGNEGEQVLHIRMFGGTGDADVGIRFGSRPDLQTVDCSSASLPHQLDNLEFCLITDPTPGTWHIMVLAWEAFTGVTIEADLQDWTELTPGVPVTGIEADFLDFTFFRIDLQGGEAVDLTISDGTGDADLFATALEQFSILDLRDLECLAGEDGNEETCTVSATSDGTWTVALFGFDEFAGVTLEAEASQAALAGMRRAGADDGYRDGGVGGGR